MLIIELVIIYRVAYKKKPCSTELLSCGCVWFRQLLYSQFTYIYKIIEMISASVCECGILSQNPKYLQWCNRISFGQILMKLSKCLNQIFENGNNFILALSRWRKRKKKTLRPHKIINRNKPLTCLNVQWRKEKKKNKMTEKKIYQFKKLLFSKTWLKFSILFLFFPLPSHRMIMTLAPEFINCGHNNFNWLRSRVEHSYSMAARFMRLHLTKECECFECFVFFLFPVRFTDSHYG